MEGPGQAGVKCHPCPEPVAATRPAADARLQMGWAAGKIYWLTEGAGPEVGFGPSGSQGFRRHRDRATPCLRSAFLCGSASLSGWLVPSGGTGGPWQLQPVSYRLGHLGEGGIPGDSQAQTAPGVARAGGGTAEPAGHPRAPRRIRANPEHCGIFPEAGLAQFAEGGPGVPPGRSCAAKAGSGDAVHARF